MHLSNAFVLSTVIFASFSAASPGGLPQKRSGGTRLMAREALSVLPSGGHTPPVSSIASSAVMTPRVPKKRSAGTRLMSRKTHLLYVSSTASGSARVSGLSGRPSAVASSSGATRGSTAPPVVGGSSPGSASAISSQGSSGISSGVSSGSSGISSGVSSGSSGLSSRSSGVSTRRSGASAASSGVQGASGSASSSAMTPHSYCTWQDSNYCEILDCEENTYKVSATCTYEGQTCAMARAEYCNNLSEGL